jgi:hypothetical protein
MIEIRIERYDSQIHCIKCGIQTVSSIPDFIDKGSIFICPHLVYLGKGGGFNENRPEYCKFYDELIQVGSNDYLQTLQETLNDEHICLNITCSDSHPPRYFVIYNLGMLSKEVQNKAQNEDEVMWNIWGSVLSKYGVSK